MVDLRKAAEIALEALEMHVLGFDGVRKMELAIESLEAALAQPEQEPVAFEDWLKNQHGDPEEIGFLQALRVAYYAGADSHPAPPSKPWVSLTDEDFDNIYKRYDTYDLFARAIEAKLKEKNT